MINHARTLLLNVHPKRAHATDIGYEYVPAGYTPLRLSSALQTINTLFFGNNPDQPFLNLRAAELLSYIHQTELAEYVYALDPRVTYWPKTTTAFDITPTTTVTQITGTRRQLTAAGTFAATNVAAQAFRQYFVALTTDGQTDALTGALLTETQEFLTAETVNEILLQESASGSDGGTGTQANTLYIKQINTPAVPLLVTLTDLTKIPVVPLPGTGVVITPAQLPAPNTNDTANWLVNLATSPPPAITTILPALELLGEPATLELFGVAPEEPYATFKNLWFDHPLPAYRLAAFVLAYIYRINESRNGNNG